MSNSNSSTNNSINNRQFRMVALDLDGTLLNSNHEVSDATVEYLRSLHQRGFIVSIATGRSAACAAKVITRLNLPSVPTIVSDTSSSNPSSQVSEKGGFPLVCTNGARGLRILSKSQSDVGASSSATAPPHRSNTEPIPPTNPFLNKTLEISEELFHTPVSPSLTLKTLALAHSLGCVTNYYHNHHIYAVVRNEKQLELTKRYAKLTGSDELYRYLKVGDGKIDIIGAKEDGDWSFNDRDDLYTPENCYGYKKAVDLGPPSKLLILCDTERLDEVTKSVRLELNGPSTTVAQSSSLDSSPQTQQAHVIRGSPPFFVEILHPEVHKGHGLRQLCRSLSIPLADVVAFGDGDNDLEFLQVAGWGVAMKNARELVKSAADEVGEWSNNEDGVMKVLQKYESEGKLNFPMDNSL